MRAQPRIAIVGLGGLFPPGVGPDGLWRLVGEGADTSRDVPPGRWLLDPADAYRPGGPSPDRVYSSRGYFLDAIPSPDPVPGVPADVLADLDPVFHLTLHAGRQAWASAVTRPLDPSRVGVVLGAIALPTEKASALARDVLGREYADQLGVTGYIADRVHPWNLSPTGLPAGLLARALGLGGGSYTLDAACASSLYAVKLAADELRAGRMDAVLAGGVSRPDCLYTQMGFSQLRALSPSGRCSPLDASADGLVVGEGAGVFVLKRLEDALRHGDRIWAVLAGAGLSNDVGGGLLSPSSEGQLRAMRQAYHEAGWSPSDVDLIECHATGTPVGDAVELQSLRELWGASGRDRASCVLGSVKSTVGHLLTAAGAAGLAKMLMALHHRTLPPSANVSSPAVGDGPFRVLRRPEPWEKPSDGRPRRAAVSGFGFGGINAHLLLEEWVGGGALSTPSRSLPVRETGKGDEAIAVVGLAARFGPWDNAEVRERLVGGLEAIPSPSSHGWGVGEVDAARSTGFHVGECRIPVDRFRIPPRELHEMLPQQLLLLDAAADALADAGASNADSVRTGVYVGLSLDPNTTNYHLRWSLIDAAREGVQLHGLDPSSSEAAQWTAGVLDAVVPALNANRTMGALASIAASRAAREFRLGGPSFTVSGEEGSGPRALELARRALQRGEIDRALVAAVDLPGDIRTIRSARRNGGMATVVGEGGAAVVLRRLEDAIRDGDHVYAVVRGVGIAGGDAEEAFRSARERAYADAGVPPPPSGELLCDASADVGQAGSASGMASLVKACLCLDLRILPSAGQHWLHDRIEGPRRAGVGTKAKDGTCYHVVLEEHAPAAHVDTPARAQPLGARPEALFAVEGESDDELAGQLLRLEAFASRESRRSVEGLARAWHAACPPRPVARQALAIVAENEPHLRSLIEDARALLANPDGLLPPASRDRVFHTASPLGGGRLAFVYPGSGNDAAGMGRDLAAHWPAVLRRQDRENEYLRSQYCPDRYWATPPSRSPDPRERIFAQVSYGTLITDLLARLGVRPDAALGYSLGESAALFALRAWADRDEMLRRMRASSLFVHDLSGPCDAARSAWGLPDGEPVDWVAGVVDRAAAEIDDCLVKDARVYRLIANAPGECVVGGQRRAVGDLVGRLGCRFVEIQGASAVHCEVVREVADAYRQLHLLPTVVDPANVQFYGTAAGEAYVPTREAAAAAILAQAVAPIDFPAVVEAAYRDGVRLFVEVGPGASCSRMIAAILAGRAHGVRSANVSGVSEVSSLLRLLAWLVAERVPVDRGVLYGGPTEASGHRWIEPHDGSRMVAIRVNGIQFEVPPLPSHANRTNHQPAQEEIPVIPVGAGRDEWAAVLSRTVEVEIARQEAHGVYLRFASALHQTAAAQLAFQTALVEAGAETVHTSSPARAEGVQEAISAPGGKHARSGPPESPRRSLSREQCLAFAVGTIRDVLGPRYAEIDSFPTRVRLPDEPLMLVDRVLDIEGEPLSLGSGRVVTEHDVSSGRWYLAEGHIPTSIAVESGQADLFLSGFLGIDLRTRGLAVYRLLDAVVTFHRELPGPEATIRYDIHIDHFFRQGDTHLFRFRFEGTVDGEPLLTMRDGCAGFFSASELAAGRGVVRTALDRQRRPGVQPADWRDLVPMAVESYTDAQLDALRDGHLADCFGPAFAGLPLTRPLGLPSGLLRLVDRVPALDPTGGRFGLGLIRGEADIRPDAWFLACHFIDDQVMPGTLMYECCLHTLRIFLIRMGWVGDRDEVRCEPVPGAASRLKCRGQVTASTRLVTYEVEIKERGYRPEPYAVADVLMYADGKAIVEIANMSLRMTGLTREGLQRMWAGTSSSFPPTLPHEGGGRSIERGDQRKPSLFGPERILAFAVGNPSEAFGEPYRVFDRERVIARLPGPPYQFLDRITHLGAEPFEMVAGGEVEAQYDVPPDAWYFAADRQPFMPFAVLLEAALQPCGWMAAYLGSALTSPTDLSFRNLGGKAEQLAEVGADIGTLTTRVKMTNVSSSAGMIIQSFTFAMTNRDRLIYRGETTFGFFSKDALAQQVGLRGVEAYSTTDDELARSEAFAFPVGPPFPDERWRMVDRVETFVPDGGPHGLGYLRGVAEVDPSAWFFKAHFYQDPVWPGSLGLESLLQLIKVAAVRRWGGTRFRTQLARPHTWTYRGQVIPASRRVVVEAFITGRDDATRTLIADGYLHVDGRVIYQMKDFSIAVAD